jgi:Peroxiredoxin
MLEQGQQLPDGVLSQLTQEGMIKHQVSTLFSGKKVVLFAVPGAFTPTCSEAHLPGYVALADQIKAKGVDLIVCVSVNDAYVMKAWGEAHNASELLMLADGDGSFTMSLGLETDTGNFGGIRSRRYAMIIENGIVTQLNIEVPKAFEVSKAEQILASL